MDIAIRYAPPSGKLKRHLRTFLDDQVCLYIRFLFDEAYLRCISRQSFSMAKLQEAGLGDNLYAIVKLPKI